MNNDNVNCTKEPYCFAGNDEDDRKHPLFLSDSISKHSANNRNYDGADDEQLVEWKLDNVKLDDNCDGIFDTNFNEICENTRSSDEKTYLDKEQCVCIEAWQRLKQYLELTDEELKRAHPLSSVWSESLDDFQLDGECLYAELDGSDSYDVNDDETSSSRDTTRVAVNERKERSADAKTINKRAKNGRHAEMTNANENNASAVEQVAGNNSKNYTESGLNNEKQQKLKFGRQTDKFYAGGKKPGMDPKSDTTKQRVNTMKYVYTYGETYRGGIQRGHTNCVEPPIMIPQNKGWITDEFIINERKNKLLFKSGDNPRTERSTTTTTAAATTTTDDRHVVQRSKPNVVSSYDAGNSGVSGPREVAAAEAAAGSTARRVTGGGPNGKEPAAALEFVKKNGTYTVTMNCLTSDGQLDAATEPVVFRLVDRTGGDADAVSSGSSFDLKCVTPNAMRALRPTRTRKDACTSYENEDFWPSNE